MSVSETPGVTILKPEDGPYTIPAELPDAEELIPMLVYEIQRGSGSMLPLKNLLEIVIAYQKTRDAVLKLRAHRAEIDRLTKQLTDMQIGMGFPRINV